MLFDVSSPITAQSHLSSQSSLEDLGSFADQLFSSQKNLSTIISRLGGEKATLERAVEAHVAQQEKTAVQTQELIDVVSAFTEKDKAVQSDLRSLLSKRDVSDHAMLEMLQANAEISLQINELLCKSADNVARTQRLVDDLVAGMKKVSQGQRVCAFASLFSYPLIIACSDRYSR